MNTPHHLRLPASSYVLRVVVYNVPLQETSLVGRQRMSDVYVKGWLQGTKGVQTTDIHYRYGIQGNKHVFKTIFKNIFYRSWHKTNASMNPLT